MLQAPKSILIVGRNAGMMQRVSSMLTDAGYTPTGVLTQNDAIRLITSRSYSAIVIGGGVSQPDRTEIKNLAAAIQTAPRVIDAHPDTILADLKHNG